MLERGVVLKRSKTPSFVIKLELYTNSKDKNIIDKRIRVAKSLYNAGLSYLIKRLKGLRGDRDYRRIIKEKQAISVRRDMAKEDKSKLRKEKTIALKVIEADYGYSLQAVTAYVNNIYKTHFHGGIGSAEVQKLCERAFDTVEKLHYYNAKKIKFESLYMDDFSIEGKTNKSGLRFIDNNFVWFDLEVPVKIDKNNSYIVEALESRTKFVRLITETIRGKQRYFIELIQEGVPPKKNRRCGSSKSTVGLDIGPSNIAIVSDDYVDLINLKPKNLNKSQAKINRLQRKMDRSRRANNPNKFNENGTIKIGNKDPWVESKNYKKLKKSLSKEYRKLRINRKEGHEALANTIVALGTDIRVEKINFKSWQKRAKETTTDKKNGKVNKKKRFGKSVLNAAPGMLLDIIDRKLSYSGENLKKINTTKCKASQYDHITNTFNKKELSERIHLAGGEMPIQRDIYSAFLIKNTMKDLESISQYKCKVDWKSFLNNYNLYKSQIA